MAKTLEKTRHYLDRSVAVQGTVVTITPIWRPQTTEKITVRVQSPSDALVLGWRLSD